MDDAAGGVGMNNITPLRPEYEAFVTGGMEPDGQSTLLRQAPVLWVEDEAWDEAAIPRRPWVVPGYFMRGAVTVISGPGSAGKSMLMVAFTIALALGRRFSRFVPSHAGKTLLYNVEDDASEQRRRFSATLRQFRASSADVAGHVVRVGPMGVGTLLRVDPITKRLSPTAAMAQLEDMIAEQRPDLVVLDPLVELHDSEENDNTAVRAVMARLRSLAATYQCAVCVLHHARKGAAGTAGDPDSLRGASAIVGAARVVITVLTMDEKEAEKLGIPEEQRRSYFRVDGAKSNYAVIEDAEWFQREAYELANGETVAAAVPWSPPSPMREVPIADLHTALERIDRGPSPGMLYTASRRGGSNRWVGTVVMAACGLNETQARVVVASWLKSGLLLETDFHNPETRKSQPGVRVDMTKRPTE